MTTTEQGHFRAAKTLQRELKTAGFDCGPIDGKVGKWTHKATAYSSSVCSAIDVARSNRDLFLAHALVSVGNLPRRIVLEFANRMPGECPPRMPSWGYNAAAIQHWAAKTYGPDQTVIPSGQYSRQLLDKHTWMIGMGGIPPQSGDIFGVWHSSLGHTGHCGAILDWCPGEKYFLSIEAQHDDRYSPREDGWPRICMRRRLRSDIYCVRHIDHEGASLAGKLQTSPSVCG